MELRPITILIGRNSAGKSTFLRSLALLRQSLEAKSSAPILWYGDYVDFGDFSSAVNQRDKGKEICFKFIAEDFSGYRRGIGYSAYYNDFHAIFDSGRGRKYEKVSFSISLVGGGGGTIRKSVVLEDPKNNIKLKVIFDKNGKESERFVVNGSDLSDMLPGHSVIFNSSDIFSSGTVIKNIVSKDRKVFHVVDHVSAFSTYISDIVGRFVDKRILPENVRIEAFKMLSHPVLNKSSLEQLSKNSTAISFKRFYINLLKDHETLAKINLACATNYVLQALSDSGGFLRNFFLQTTYLGPARARSERYYRYQELEISEIAPDGHNLPMFLGSLAVSQLNSFSEWVRDLFGFGVGVQRNEGHISIQLKRDSLDVNVTDTGYGVSQLLPVLAQIWWSSKSPRNSKRRSASESSLYPITMEQPELHLHPAHQAKLADAFLSALPNSQKKSFSSPVFVVETHSETLINRLGELIEKGDLNAKDVQIVIFSNDDSDSNLTNISTSTYDSEGVLSNWPFGFFSY